MGATQGHISRDGEWQIDRATKQVGRWLIGVGFLSLDVGLFLVTATALFLLDLYQDPQHIDVADKLRPWALVIIFHTIAVLILWIMSWALQAGKSDSEKAPQSTPQRAGPIPIAATGGAQPRPRFSPTVSTPVIIDSHEESERFWRRRSTAIWRQHDPGRQETWGWSSTDEAELTHTWPDGDRYDTAPSGPPYGPYQTASDTVIEPNVTPRQDVVGTAEQQSASDNRDTPVKQEDKVLDPLRFASRQNDANGNDDKDGILTRWLWVEAAAAAWLAQREDEPESSDGADSKPLYPPIEGDSPEALQ
jgi:hypothetical protein